MKSILSEQMVYYSSPNGVLAKQIYDAKGELWDNEFSAVKAILAIKNAKQYYEVNKLLQNLTGGRGIGQYVSGFIQVRGESDFNSEKGKLTLQYIDRIVKHLTKIKAPYQSIKFFYDKVDRIEKLNQRVADISASQGQLGGQLAWETFAERAKKDPEFKHAYLQCLQIASLFIPGVGLYIAAGIGLADAGAYAVEGEYYEAGLATVFALLPGMGKLVTKIPAIRWLGAKGLTALGEKMATSKNPMLNWIERQFITDMSKYKNIVKKDMDAYFKARAKQEAVKLAKYQGKTKAGKILQKVGDGTISLSKFGTKFVAQGGAYAVSYNKAAEIWDKVYRTSGIADAEGVLIKKKIGSVDNLLNQ